MPAPGSNRAQRWQQSADTLAAGRLFRILTVVDNFNREVAL
jgi:hypothetical protein